MNDRMVRQCGNIFSKLDSEGMGENDVNWRVLGFCFHFYFKFDGLVYVHR